MELQFKKTPNGHIATGEAGKYVLTLANGLWSGKIGRETIFTKVKGFTPAVSEAQEYEDTYVSENSKPAKSPASKPTASKATVNTGKSPASKPTATASKPTRKPKPFPSKEEWITENIEPKGRRESAADYDKRLKGAVLKWGQARAKYNRENGIEAEPVKPIANTGKSPASKPTREPKPKREPMTAEEKHGPTWNNYFSQGALAEGSMEYAEAQLTNAYASRDYSIQHGRVHPFGTAAQNSYYKSVERVYACEERIITRAEKSGEKLPKGFEPQYFGLTIQQIDAAESDALNGYIDFYAQGLHLPEGERAKHAKTFDESTLKLYPLFEKPKTRGTAARRR